jgi:hypothetical protein
MMIIQRSASGTYSAFQRLPSAGNKKVGFISEGESVSEAIDGIIWAVAEHCTKTGDHPTNILESPQH